MRNFKIGIYISSNNFIGGAFQYTETMIDAISSLGRNVKKYIIAEREVIKDYSIEKDFQKILINENDFQKKISVLFSRFTSSKKTNIIFNNFFYDKIRKINSLNLDLIVFPTQDRESFIINSKPKLLK